MTAAAPPSCVTLLANSPVGAIVCDAEDLVVWVNATACRLFAASPDALVGAPLESVMQGPGQGVGDDIMRYLLRDDSGRRRWLECAVSTLAEADMKLRLVTDISEFENRQRGRAAVVSGLEPSRIDDVTGVLNRRAILQEMTAQISRSRRYGNALSVLRVRYSDCGKVEEGEVVHETTARRVAQCLNEELRWVDSVGTMSSGQLLVVLPETDDGAARQVVQKVTTACNDIALAAEGAALAYDLKLVTWAREDDVQSILTRLREAPTSAAA